MKQRQYREEIVKYAIGSRLILFTLQLLSNLIPDHDANVFLYPKDNITLNVLDKTVLLLFDGFTKWDAQYFIHIALYGYTYENIAAFFPLYPLIIGYLSQLLSYVTYVLNIQSVLLLVSFTFNLYIFKKTALVLFELSRIFGSVDFAYTVAILFCFNPASIFFSAVYSECLFCYLTFQSIFYGIQFSLRWMHSNAKYLSIYKCMYCVYYTSLSMVTRSNGILNVIFFIYLYLRVASEKNLGKRTTFLKNIIISLVILLLYLILMLIPFLFVQIYDYRLFCSIFENDISEFLVNFGKKHKLILRGSFLENNQSWCYKSLPFAYSYVQDHYWNVGFLKYYEFKQLPNFCLALPVVYLSIKNVINYLSNHKDTLIHFGILRKLTGFNSIVPGEKIKSEPSIKLLLFDIEFALIIHVLALTIFCVLFIHVQVTTRMLFSSTPIIYWFCCRTLYSQNTIAKLFVKYYFATYFVLGTIMFCNFLPWT